jgi:peptide chain release factor subunit 3
MVAASHPNQVSIEIYVEFGRANFDTPKKRWTIFEKPVYNYYFPDMMMGAAFADYGALVISAKEGEFEICFEA